MKRMSRFQSSSLLPLAQCEDHYLKVHHAFARDMFRYHAPTVQRYATGRATAQYDLNAGFAQAPDVWRFIVLEFEDHPDDAGGESSGEEWLPPWAEEAIVNDHTNFLREVRPFRVEPDVLVDRRTGQTTTVKYVFEFERAEDASADECRRARNRIRAGLVEAGDHAFGLRLLTENRVTTEAAMEPVREAGQAYGGRTLDETTMMYIDEYYFDHEAWGDEFFGSEGVRGLLRATPFRRIGGYKVDELVGVDRT